MRETKRRRSGTLQRARYGCLPIGNVPFSAANQSNNHLAVQLAFPLAVDVHLGHFDRVAHFEPQRRLVVGVGHSGLFHSGVRRQLALQSINYSLSFVAAAGTLVT